MYAERALSCHTRNRFMLTNLEFPISRLRGGMGSHYAAKIYTIDKQEVMAQKAEKMLLKIINE